MVNKLKWTKEKCKEEALKYKTRSEFFYKKSHVYKISRINNWLDDFYPKKK